ncbi:MAG: alpha/beta hydrolase [Pseudomonadota bacterium]
MPVDPKSGVYFEVDGDGPFVFLGPILGPSQRDYMGDMMGDVVDAYIDGLKCHFTVIIADYPSIGQSTDIPPQDLTAARCAHDLLSVALAAGAERFTFWGYSWGASVALQLAIRTERLDGLVMGGWPPLGAPFDTILQGARLNVSDPPSESMVMLRRPAQYQQWVSYYESLIQFDQQAALQRVTCPALVYHGDTGDSDAGGLFLPIASAIRENADAIEQAGWTIKSIAGAGHEVVMKPAEVLRVVRPFLDDLYS